MKFFIYNSIALLIVFTCLYSNAQEQKKNAEKDLAALMGQVRNGKTDFEKIDNILLYDHQILVQAIEKYHSDSSVNVRFITQTILYKIAVESENNSVRQKIAGLFVNSGLDPEPLIMQQAAGYLLMFHSSDFSADSRNMIRQLISGKNPKKEWILICGVADIPDQKPVLKKMIADKNDTPYAGMGSWYRSVSWYARLALARMGSKKNVNFCIRKVEQDTNEILRVTILLKDMAYTRNKKSIKVITRYLNSDERLPSVKETILGTSFYQHALDLLTQVIKDFPVKHQGMGYTQAEIDISRKFMKKNRKLHIIK